MATAPKCSGELPRYSTAQLPTLPSSSWPAGSQVWDTTAEKVAKVSTDGTLWMEDGVGIPAPLMRLDFTTAAVPSQVTVTRTGVACLAQRSKSTCVEVPANGIVWEDDGEGRAGLLSAGADWANEWGADAVGMSGWTAINSVIVEDPPPGVTGPDGTNRVVRLRDRNTGGVGGLVRGSNGDGANRVGKLWYRYPSPPTCPGGLQLHSAFNFCGKLFGTLPEWRVLSWFNQSGSGVAGGGQWTSIWASGYERQAAGYSTGSYGDLDVGARQLVKSNFDYPIALAAGAAGPQTIRLTALSSVLDGGAFHVRLRFCSLHHGMGLYVHPTAYLYWHTASDGETSIRFDTTTSKVYLRVRGVDVLDVTMGAWPHLVNCEVVAKYDPIAGQSYLRVRTGGALDTRPSTDPGGDGEAYGTTTGTLLQTPTEAWLMSKQGATVWPARLREVFFMRRAEPHAFEPEGMIIGDSHRDIYVGAGLFRRALTASWIYTPAQAESRPGIVSLAVGGQTTPQQQTEYQASPYRYRDLKWIIVASGYNDVVTGTPGSAAAPALANLQTLLTLLRAEHASAKILVARLQPTAPGFSSYNADRTTFNAGLAALTWHDGVIDELEYLLDNHDRQLLTHLNLGDTHNHDEGSQMIAELADRPALQRVGVLPS
jgi:hypothetical protein